MEALEILVDKLDALGVLVVVIAYLLVKDRWASPAKKANNPNGVIRAVDNLRRDVETQGRRTDDRLAAIAERTGQVLERLDNMGRNSAATSLAVLQGLDDVKTTCTMICERLGDGGR